MKYFKFYIRIDGLTLDEIEYYVFTTRYDIAQRMVKEYIKSLNIDKMKKVYLYNA